MLLLRYQRQRQLDAEDGCHRVEQADRDVRPKINERDLKGESRRAATRGTLICIFVCGSLLLSLGLTLLLAGLLIPRLKSDPTPWLVTGPTCIVLGILVLLLSIEIILKLRKISAESELSDDSNADQKKGGWGCSSEAETKIEEKRDHISSIPVVIQPPTPLQPLNPSALPSSVPDRK